MPCDALRYREFQVPLTQLEIDEAEAREKPYRLSDGNGLAVLVEPSGRKRWVSKYRFAGRQQSKYHGLVGEVGPRKARQENERLRSQIADGVDPKAHRLVTTTAAFSEGPTITEAVGQWCDHQLKQGRAESTVRRNRKMMRDVIAAHGGEPAADMTPEKLMALIATAEAADHHEKAKRILNCTRMMMRFLRGRKLIKVDPLRHQEFDLVGAQHQHMPAVVDPSEFAAVANVIWSYENTGPVGHALRFMMLTCVRQGEIRSATWDQFDLEQRIWFRAAGQTKSRREDETMLSSQAMNVLTAMLRIPDRHPDTVFALKHKRPLSENALGQALHRSGLKGVQTAHGLRASARSIIESEASFDRDVVRMCLSHKVVQGVEAAYNRYDYRKEKRAVMDWWGRRCATYRITG